QKFDANGTFIAKWGGQGAGDGQFNYPMGIAVAPDGSVYAADTGNNRIQKFDANGIFITKWGGFGAGNGQFSSPMGIAVAPDGSVYVLDTNNNRIQKFGANGTFIARWGFSVAGDAQYSYSRGIAVAPDGSVYVASTDNHNIRKFDANGIFIAKWGSYGNGDGQFYSPRGIAVAPDGSVYAADTGNNRIQRMSVAGSEILFSANIPVNQLANTLQDYAIDAGIINATGKLYLEATLTNSLGQTVATSSYPFYIVGGNTALLFNTDKKFYKPGETVTITGEVRNLAVASLDNATLTLVSGAASLLNQTFSVAAGGSHAFTVTTVAGAKGVVQLLGSVKQSGAMLVEISESYEVAEPAVALTLSAPDVVGKGPFDLTVEIKNTGKTDAAVDVIVSGAQVSDNQRFTIPAGQTRLLQYNQTIAATAVYTIAVTGDVSASASKTVAFGEAANVTLSAASVYAEGSVSVPISVVNTGQIAEDISVTYSLTGNSGVVSTLTKSYYLPLGASVADAINFDLVKGGYTLSAQGTISGVSASSSLTVLKTEDVAMTLNVGAQSSAGATVTVGVSNGGINPVNGAAQVTVVDATGATVWSGETPLTDVLTGAAASPAFNIATAGLAPGAYTVKAAVYDGAGRLVTSSVSPLNVIAPVFVVTPPANIAFDAGTTGSLAFSVTNAGGQEGEAALTVKALDDVDSVVKEWIKPGETKTYSFPIAISADLEDKDYFAVYGLNGTQGQVKFHVNGIKITVNAALDRDSYGIGDTAALSMQVTDNRVNTTPVSDLNLFARVNFAGFEGNQPFTLGTTPSVTLQFNVPVSALTGEKLFYGVYHESGRSIHLNSLYVYDSGGLVNITTDKQVYNPGETVSMTINGTGGGQLTLTGPGNYTDTFAFTGSAARSLLLPARMTAGTYYVNYRLTDAAGGLITGAHPIDVAGIQVKVKEATLDKAKYPSVADVVLKLTIESNRDMAATLKTWFVDAAGAYTASVSKGITLTSDAPVQEGLTASFTTSSLGIHRFVYAIYDNDMLLSSGSEAFDVGEAMLLGVSTDKSDYPLGTEAVNAAISLFGAVPATVDLYVDGLSAGTFTAALNGFTTHTVPLTGVTPGAHILKAALNSGGLTSTKETGFVYGSALPDLSVSISPSGAVGVDNKMAVTVTVVNTGKTASTATTVTLYDAAPGGGIGAALETFSVGPLAPGASASFTHYLDAVGMGGAHTLYASVNAGNSVFEFNNSNNTVSAPIEVPDAVFYTTIGADVNYTGNTMYITANITNLSAAQMAGLTLVTSVKNQSGAQVHSTTEAMPAINAVTRMPFVTQWYIPDDSPEGQYAVSQTLGMGSRSYGTTVMTVTIKPGRDFTMESSHTGLKVESGGTAEFTVGLTPVRGFADEVTLSVSGAPQGATVRLSKDTLTPPDSSVLSIGATGVAAGAYVITVSASGGGKTHSVDLTLDVTDFSVTVAQPIQTVKELETAVYGVDLTPLNGFESSVILNIEGMPRGMKAAFDVGVLTLPSSGRMVVRTSKWLIPGVYGFKITARGATAYHEQAVTLTVTPNPLIAPGIVTVPGPGPKNDALIKKFNGKFAETGSFYTMRKAYGTNVVAGDLDGDGIDEIIVGNGADLRDKHKRHGRLSEDDVEDATTERDDSDETSTIDIFRRDGTLMASINLPAFASKYGVTLAVGDIDGDWKEELIVGSGPDTKAAGRVKVYKFDGTGLVDTGIDLYPYVNERYKYGVNLALGDIDGDGLPEIITAPGPDPNAPPKVKAFKIDAADGAGLWRTTGESAAFTAAFGAVPAYGANVAAADLNADGKAEIVVGAGPDPNLTAQNVLVYDSTGAFTGRSYAAGVKPNYGAYVSTGDLDLDGKAEVITGSGPDPKNVSIVRVFREDGIILGEFTAYVNTIKYGVKPVIGRVGE
ncbi:MAG: FG-GAP repeat protein, partial [Deltaproteobacteria bacterium]|nr:FG-GAP repeat protein [Deltaproteobacteria bacterium]